MSVRVRIELDVQSSATIEQAATLSTLQIGLDWFPDGLGGGSSRYFSTLTSHLKNWMVVHGVVVGRHAGNSRQIDDIRIACRQNATVLTRVSAVRASVAQVIAEHRIDLVVSHFPLFTFFCLDLLMRFPIIVHFHGPWAAESRFEGKSVLINSSKYLIEKTVYARAKRFIVLTQAFRDTLHRHYGVPIERIAVIPGGVDVGRFNLTTTQYQARMRLGLPANRFIILTVRRLAKRMGLENLIRAFAQVRRINKEALLVIAGSGKLSDALQELTCIHGLTDGVLLTGRVSEASLPLYYRAADISVVPSIALEGFGLVVAESLACGTPALVTPVGGLPEVVVGLSRNLIFRDSTPTGIAEGLIAAIEGRLNLPCAEDCAAYAGRLFSWPAIAQQVASVYKQSL